MTKGVSGLFLAGALIASAAATDTLLIRNTDVYPVSGPVLKGYSVLIEDGKIAEVNQKIVAPKGIRVLEGKGLRVYPGMIDSNTELGLSEISAVRETVDSGEIGEFMPQLRALIAINPGSEHIPVVRANGLTSVVTFPAAAGRGGGGGRGTGQRQMISGQAAMIHLDGWTWEDMAVKRSAAMELEFPAIQSGGGRGGFGGFGGGTAQTFTEEKRTHDQEVQKLSEFFDEARQYQKAKAAGAPDFKIDLKMEAMIPVLDGKLAVAIPAARERAIKEAVAWGEKEHLKIIILNPRELGKAAEDLKAHNIPVILGPTLALPENEDDPYDQAPVLPSEFYKAGIKFAFASFNNEFSRNVPYQAATAVAYGLPYDEALKAVTLNAAQIWGVSDMIGSVEKGKWADLMVTDGDPLETQTQVKHLYIKGKEVDLSNKQTRLYEKYLNRP